MFLLHYTCSIFRSINSKIAFKFLSKRVVVLLYENQSCYLYVSTQNNVCGVDEEPGGGA